MRYHGWTHKHTHAHIHTHKHTHIHTHLHDLVGLDPATIHRLAHTHTHKVQDHPLQYSSFELRKGIIIIIYID